MLYNENIYLVSTIFLWSAYTYFTQFLSKVFRSMPHIPWVFHLRMLSLFKKHIRINISFFVAQTNKWILELYLWNLGSSHEADPVFSRWHALLTKRKKTCVWKLNGFEINGIFNSSWVKVVKNVQRIDVIPNFWNVEI